MKTSTWIGLLIIVNILVLMLHVKIHRSYTQPVKDDAGIVIRNNYFVKLNTNEAVKIVEPVKEEESIVHTNNFFAYLENVEKSVRTPPGENVEKFQHKPIEYVEPVIQSNYYNGLFFGSETNNHWDTQSGEMKTWFIEAFRTDSSGNVVESTGLREVDHNWSASSWDGKSPIPFLTNKTAEVTNR